MEDIDICLLLKASLDAAFRGKYFSGPEEIRAWGEEVVSLLREGYPKYRYLNEFIRDIADNALLRMCFFCDNDDLKARILYKPETFLKSVILMVDYYRKNNEIKSPLPADIH